MYMFCHRKKIINAIADEAQQARGLQSV